MKHWILPTGEIAPAPGGHGHWLLENQGTLQRLGLNLEEFSRDAFEGGLDSGPRVAAFQKGFFRVELESGVLMVEGLFWRWHYEVIEAIRSIVSNARGLQSIGVFLLNDSGKMIARSRVEDVSTLPGAEKIDRIPFTEDFNFVRDIRDSQASASLQTRLSDIGMPESELYRVGSIVEAHDVAVISAIRDTVQYGPGASEGQRITPEANEESNRRLNATLLRLGYGVTAIDGSRMEGFNTNARRRAGQDFFLAVNLMDCEDFPETVSKLGEYFCQDYVLIRPYRGEAYLFGTSHAAHLGYHHKAPLPHFQPENAVWQLTGRLIHFETFAEYGCAGKGLIARASKRVMDDLNLVPCLVKEGKQ